MDFKETKLSDNFWCFEQNMVRCFLFKGEPFSLLVDSCYGGELKALCEDITGNEVRLLITHSDRDHTGCIPQFEHRYMHPSEFSLLCQRGLSPVDFEPVWDGDTIDIETFQFEILHLPGHTPGSLALLDKRKRFLLAADNVQTGPIYMFGEYRSLAAYAASMSRLCSLRESFDVCYSSHFDLSVAPDIIDDLRVLADEMSRGILPPVLPLPEPLPPSVPSDRHLYVKNGAKFYF